MSNFGIFGICVVAVLLFGSNHTLASVTKNSKTDRDATSTNIVGKNSSLGSSLPGLSSLHGLTQGLGLGLRRRRSVSNNIPNTKLGGKDSTCICQAIYDPVCGSNGKTYANKCLLECEQRKLGKIPTKTGKNSMKGSQIKAPSLKFVKKGSCINASVLTTASPVDSQQETIIDSEVGKVGRNVNRISAEPGYTPRIMSKSIATSKVH